MNNNTCVKHTICHCLLSRGSSRRTPLTEDRPTDSQSRAKSNALAVTIFAVFHKEGTVWIVKYFNIHLFFNKAPGNGK